MPSDPERRVLTLPGGPATVTDAGEGPVVVALHGLPGTVRDFRWLGAALEPRLRLVRVDLPGFGGTARGGRTLDERADFVARVLDALGIERAVVLGHSMGGGVATAVAVRHADRTDGLVLLASIGLRRHRIHRAIPGGPWWLSALLSVPPLRALTMPLNRRLFALGGFKGWDDATLVETMHVLGATSLAEHAANLRALRVPTMVVWSEDDPLVEAAIGEELYWGVPPGPRIRFATGGHALANSRACEVADALAAWVPSLRS